jgi:hypothetical protein
VFYQHLDTNGDGTGTLNANVNGTTPVEFYIEAADNDVLELHRIIIHIADNGSIQPHTYGALAALTNGVKVTVVDADDNVLQGGVITVKANAEWGRVCFDVEIQDRGAGSDGYVNVRWTFAKAGVPLRLRDGEKFVVTIQDDLTGLLEHYFMVQGVRV